MDAELSESSKLIGYGEERVSELTIQRYTDKRLG